MASAGISLHWLLADKDMGHEAASTGRTSHQPGDDSAHPRAIHKTAEFLGAVHLVLCVFLQRVVLPLPRISQLLPNRFLRHAIAAILMILGVTLLRATHKELATFEQPHEPGRPTTDLVVTGPFAYSRHPTYLSIVVFLVPSVALFSDNTWIMITSPLAIVAFQYLMIRPEEAYLLGKFPDQYKRYYRETWRWYGRNNKGLS
mmetsp:Transcript_17316/g.34743  ORF Transcript_17316/g.34743 Transcript_17316/m.34743 type:complete len:202 (+) Transcript_17316:78-683(+)